jgi:hypothetical protein
VSLIQNEDLEAISGWSENSSFSEVPGIINTVVRSGIDFNNVE